MQGQDQFELTLQLQGFTVTHSHIPPTFLNHIHPTIHLSVERMLTFPRIHPSTPDAAWFPGHVHHCRHATEPPGDAFLHRLQSEDGHEAGKSGGGDLHRVGVGSTGRGGGLRASSSGRPRASDRASGRLSTRAGRGGSCGKWLAVGISNCTQTRPILPDEAALLAALVALAAAPVAAEAAEETCPPAAPWKLVWELGKRLAKQSC